MKADAGGINDLDLLHLLVHQTRFGALEAENGWDLICDVKYSPITVQKITRLYKLDSARFMLRGRLVGPTHTQ